MKHIRLRGLVLSAGFGTRLRPLTHAVPKPLLPICGEPIAGWTLRQLGKVGCESAVLNTHYLADQIPAYFGASYYGLPLRFSFEPEIQGTYGALFGPREHLQEADAVLMINGDSLCRWPLKRLVRRHLKTEADVTLLLHHRAPDDALGGGIGVDSEGRVVQFRDYTARGEVQSRHIFAGAHVLSSKLLDRVEQRPGDIIQDLYQPLLEEGKTIATVRFGGLWHDLGTPDRYLTAHLDWARGRRPRSLWRGAVVSKLARCGENIRLSRSIVDEADIGDGAVVVDSHIMSGARIGKDCRIEHAVVGPGVVLADASNVDHRMITRFDKRHELGPGESVMGDLIYTPLS